MVAHGHLSRGLHIQIIHGENIASLSKPPLLPFPPPLHRMSFSQDKPQWAEPLVLSCPSTFSPSPVPTRETLVFFIPKPQKRPGQPSTSRGFASAADRPPLDPDLQPPHTLLPPCWVAPPQTRPVTGRLRLPGRSGNAARPVRAEHVCDVVAISLKGPRASRSRL